MTTPWRACIREMEAGILHVLIIGRRAILGALFYERKEKGKKALHACSFVLFGAAWDPAYMSSARNRREPCLRAWPGELTSWGANACALSTTHWLALHATCNREGSHRYCAFFDFVRGRRQVHCHPGTGCPCMWTEKGVPAAAALCVVVISLVHERQRADQGSAWLALVGRFGRPFPVESVRARVPCACKRAYCGRSSVGAWGPCVSLLGVLLVTVWLGEWRGRWEVFSGCLAEGVKHPLPSSPSHPLTH
jgi:hypothetical protein